MHLTGFEGPEMARVTNELDAIVGGTERATEQILASAEEIDQMAHTLAARLKDEQNQALVADMQERVIKIFEACNFQDLTGQRITKVVGTLKFIETHIVRMMEIWGGLDAFKDIEAETDRRARGRRQAAQRPEDRGRGRPRLAGRYRRAVRLQRSKSVCSQKSRTFRRFGLGLLEGAAMERASRHSQCRQAR